MNNDITEGGWQEWRRLIFSEIEHHEDKLTDHAGRILKIEASVIKLQLMAAIFGAIGGAVIVGIVQLLLS